MNKIGHRDSIDFDFFTSRNFDTVRLFEKIRKIFSDYSIKKIQEEKNTLSVIINERVKLSFFVYKYPLVKKFKKTENINMASITDIGCMKLSAILGRSTTKDYVDLYFILQEIPLKELILYAGSKFQDTDINVFLKSLVYFEDMEEEPINFKHNKKVSIETVENLLTNEVKKLGIFI